MDSTVELGLGCSILVIALLVLGLVFFSPSTTFSFRALIFDWLMMRIDYRRLLLIGSDYCVIRESEDGSSCLYRGCSYNLWWVAWVIVAVWAEGAFVDLIWRGCIYSVRWDAGCWVGFYKDGCVWFFFPFWFTFDWNYDNHVTTILGL